MHIKLLVKLIDIFLNIFIAFDIIQHTFNKFSIRNFNLDLLCKHLDFLLIAFRLFA